MLAQLMTRTYLAERAIVVEAREAGDVLWGDGWCILLEDQRIGVGWVSHHQHLHSLPSLTQHGAVVFYMYSSHKKHGT